MSQRFRIILSILNVRDVVRVDFQLAVGAATETITVTADVAKLQTENGEVTEREFPFSTLPLRKIIRQRPSRYKLKSPCAPVGCGG